MSSTLTIPRKDFFARTGRLALAVTLLLALAPFLAFVSNAGLGLQGWFSFFVILLVGAGILAAAWAAVQASEGQAAPTWVAWLIAGGVVLRLAAGIFWFSALPRLGHGNPNEQAGYVMADAHTRDTVAWKLSQSQKPLWTAFEGRSYADQYGGMLFLSALVYRALGGVEHQPLLMVVLTACFSALAVLFAWAFARRAWGEPVGKITAVALAFYPEAVLLGSSQLRESFTVTLTIAAFYGLIYQLQGRKASGGASRGLFWIFGAVLLCLPFSPPVTAALVGMLAVTALFTSGTFFEAKTRQRWFWFLLAVIAVLALAGAWLALKQFAPPHLTNPVDVLGWWLRKSAEYQAHLTKSASGWIQKIFKSTPEEVHIPLLTAYGVVQPFLPAALIKGSQAPVWQWISIWRAVGWTVLLPFLLYAPMRVFFMGKGSRLVIALVLVVWAWILLTAYRAGGDQWDNVRYRATFAGLQVALAAWAFWEQRRSQDPWLRRALVGLLLIFAWFVPWYIRRVVPFEWPVVDLFKTVGLGVASAVLYVVWDWARKPGR
jgi:hypothetical protein